jgi:NAD(P)-dependent dehydrogenase (short-subunit alcohol dehydrogenase family)
MSMRQIIAEQYTTLPLLISESTCKGKTYIVTGANSGLGLETARHLVSSAAERVILAVRNSAAGEKAKADIERTTGRKSVVEVWPLDLSSYASVKAFVSRAKKEFDRVDGLIENAGVFLDAWTLAEGMETSMTVNVVSTLMLGVLMMPKMMESAMKYDIKPRVVFVVSGLGFQSAAKKELAKGGKKDIFRGLDNEKSADMSQRSVLACFVRLGRTNCLPRYGLTKLVQMYAVRAFADAYPVEKTGVIVNMVAPGICSTSLGRDASMVFRASQRVIRAVWARTAEEGSRTMLHAVLADEATHGKHLSGCAIKE